MLLGDQRIEDIVDILRHLAQITGQVEAQNRQQSLRWVLFSGSRPRQIWCNGAKKKTAGEIAGVLPTMCYPCEQQPKAAIELKASLANIGLRMFRPIRRSPKIDEMTFAQKPIAQFSPRSNPARDYRDFVKVLFGEKEGGVPYVL